MSNLNPKTNLEDLHFKNTSSTNSLFPEIFKNRARGKDSGANTLFGWYAPREEEERGKEWGKGRCSAVKWLLLHPDAQDTEYSLGTGKFSRSVTKRNLILGKRGKLICLASFCLPFPGSPFGELTASRPLGQLDRNLNLILWNIMIHLISKVWHRWDDNQERERHLWESEKVDQFHSPIYSCPPIINRSHCSM